MSFLTNNIYSDVSSMQTQASIMIPTVIEKSENGERAYDLYSRLMAERIIIFSGEVNDTMANIAIAQLLFLDYQNKDKPINMFINSPGGSVTAGLGVFDTMRKIGCPVITVCTGMAASMGAFLLAAGDVRMALPNSKVMIHQPLGGARGQATDIEITAREILKTRAQLNRYLSEFSGQPLEKISLDTERDFWLSAEEAKTYGLVDIVHQPVKKSFIKADLIKNLTENN